mmetsp:Transcript_41892/g.65472  ORF Transcript_41892/g.65472 Transcript_41892/m.65472 type:complete len:171 (-) Transcript_41892:597-1109(-)
MTVEEMSSEQSRSPTVDDRRALHLHFSPPEQAGAEQVGLRLRVWLLRLRLGTLLKQERGAVTLQCALRARQSRHRLRHARALKSAKNTHDTLQILSNGLCPDHPKAQKNIWLESKLALASISLKRVQDQHRPTQPTLSKGPEPGVATSSGRGIEKYLSVGKYRTPKAMRS